MGSLSMTYRLIPFSGGFSYFLKLMTAFPGLWHGLGTLGGVQEPSGPILESWDVELEMTSFASFAGFRQFLSTSRQDFAVKGSVFAGLAAFLTVAVSFLRENQDLSLQ